MEAALDGIKVLELCSMVAGPFCTKIMADMGAEVLKVESPETGDEARRRGPFPGDIPPEASWQHFIPENTHGLFIKESTHYVYKVKPYLIDKV